MFEIDTGTNAPSYAPVAPQSPENGFAKHGIQHLSASSLNLWSNAPDAWIARYLHGEKGTFTSAPVRGQCVEQAVVATLSGQAPDVALAEALARFDRTFPKPSEDDLEERANIVEMTRISVDALAGYGVPDPTEAGQERIEITCAFDTWSIPVIGFLDMSFSGLGLVIDLKTTTRVPSKMSADHQLQRAIYAKAKGNMAVKFLYASTKKTALLEDGDPGLILARAKAQIARMSAFLCHCDKDTATRIVPHNPESFYWNGMAQARYNLFGT